MCKVYLCRTCKDIYAHLRRRPLAMTIYYRAFVLSEMHMCSQHDGRKCLDVRLYAA